MCVIGNPPYSGHSSNKGEWISSLVEEYKKSPELRAPGQGKWLSDDYVKFIRYAEHLIAKSGEGVLGYITNHSYLDNPTFFEMRQHLMQTFDEIFIYDLHGSVRRSGAIAAHVRDENVFDIQQGVAIIIAVKRRGGVEHKRVSSTSVTGTRKYKDQWLRGSKVRQAGETDITPKRKPWLFVQKNWDEDSPYLQYPPISELFSPYGKPAPAVRLDARSVRNFLGRRNCRCKGPNTTFSGKAKLKHESTSVFVLRISGHSTKQAKSLRWIWLQIMSLQSTTGFLMSGPRFMIGMSLFTVARD